MATKYGTLELIANEIGRALEPLQDELQSGDVIEFFTELGVTFPPALTLASGFTGALSTAVSTAATIPTQLLDLETAIANEDYQDILAKLGTLTSTISSLKSQIQQVSAQLGMLSRLTGNESPGCNGFRDSAAEKNAGLYHRGIHRRLQPGVREFIGHGLVL